MKDTIKRWSVYITIFVVSMLLTDQYREYRQLKEFEAVRKDLIRQEQMTKPFGNDQQEAVKDQERKCLVNALYYEARSEGSVGILAVASVIENRKNSSRYPDDYCSVINQRKQFSYTLQGKPDVERIEWRLKSSDKVAYGYVSDVANSMVEGQFKPVLEHSVLWYAKTSVRNYWTKTKAVATRIGNHVFYKEKETK
jgi:spore germination cell wall hydrolase CwlJ-like protein